MCSMNCTGTMFDGSALIFNRIFQILTRAKKCCNLSRDIPKYEIKDKALWYRRRELGDLGGE